LGLGVGLNRTDGSGYSLGNPRTLPNAFGPGSNLNLYFVLDIYVVVTHAIEYSELVERVGKKIRLSDFPAWLGLKARHLARLLGAQA
jgi:hypothetical protein